MSHLNRRIELSAVNSFVTSWLSDAFRTQNPREQPAPRFDICLDILSGSIEQDKLLSALFLNLEDLGGVTTVCGSTSTSDRPEAF